MKTIWERPQWVRDLAGMAITLGIFSGVCLLGLASQGRLSAQQVEAEPVWKKHDFAIWKKPAYRGDAWDTLDIYILKHHRTGSCWIGERTDAGGADYVRGWAPAPKEVCQ